jgi:hypothetical protein
MSGVRDAHEHFFVNRLARSGRARESCKVAKFPLLEYTERAKHYQLRLMTIWPIDTWPLNLNNGRC